MVNIDQINFENKRVVIRVDFNVPLDDNFNITDDTRMRAALPTINKVLNDNGMVVLMSHLGRPKKNPDPKFSIKPIIKHLEELLNRPVQFADDCMKAADQVNALKPGEVLVLENLRFYAEEEGKPRGIEKGEEGYDEAKKAIKASQKEFTKTLASYGEYYINDAFGTAHRAHASTALIADYFDADHKMFGYLMGKEVAAVNKVMNDIQRPFTAIMGGSKVSTKIEIIENLLTKVDNLILCGGMTYTFKKALGGKIGNSICEEDKLDLALDILAKAKEKGSWGIWAGYRMLGGNTALMASEKTMFRYCRGWNIGVNYTLQKNILLSANYFRGSFIEDPQEDPISGNAEQFYAKIDFLF